ncbi:hypothetical protein BD414DRAFT_498117 [Trametes punicea]|nr:hypothetical protein BD414DRAFT_498117 [Trametes punicea]
MEPPVLGLAKGCRTPACRRFSCPLPLSLPRGAIFALAFLGRAVQASPLALGGLTDAAASFPVADLDSIVAKMNTTLPAATHGGIHADAPQGIYPATLFLCPTTSCISCFPLDMSILPPNTCLAEQLSNIASATISQPSNQGLPYGVYVGGSDCSVFQQIPLVNTCFNINMGIIATDIAIN